MVCGPAPDARPATARITGTRPKRAAAAARAAMWRDADEVAAGAGDAGADGARRASATRAAGRRGCREPGTNAARRSGSSLPIRSRIPTSMAGSGLVDVPSRCALICAVAAALGGARAQFHPCRCGATASSQVRAGASAIAPEPAHRPDEVSCEVRRSGRRPAQRTGGGPAHSFLDERLQRSRLAAPGGERETGGTITPE